MQSKKWAVRSQFIFLGNVDIATCCVFCCISNTIQQLEQYSNLLHWHYATTLTSYHDMKHISSYSYHLPRAINGKTWHIMQLFNQSSNLQSPTEQIATCFYVAINGKNDYHVDANNVSSVYTGVWFPCHNLVFFSIFFLLQ